MSLSNRRSGRRVAAVIVGASLLVLGLEAPAFAAPAITGFTPSSGPTDCVIVVTGSGFLNPDIQDGDVEIGGVAADFEVQSDTEIWVAANGTTGLITITNSLNEGPATSPVAFVNTGDEGNCAATITALSPDCGTVGTPVEIQGTNLISFAGVSNGINVAGDFESGDVEFSPFVAGAGKPATATGVPDGPAALHVSVPVDAQTGPVLVETDVARVLSTAAFTVVTDAALCPSVEPPPGDRHERNVRLRLRTHLIAKGRVRVPDGFMECAQNVPVKIQRKRPGGWKTVRATNTSVTGSFKKRLPDKPGVYRAVAKKITLPDTGDVCVKDVSNRVRHRH